ncbi:hypothetical protein J4410_04815 [Candidatus Woesearchaeota archaeon]|nr:hypothetical protein [Candidatus Woesearchaeota archaeon]
MTSILIGEIHHLKQGFSYTQEIPLMGFKGELDQFLVVLTDLFQYTGVGKDHNSYVAFLKLQELRQELNTLYDIRKIKTVSLHQRSKEGEAFWLALSTIDIIMKNLITFLEKEKTSLLTHYSTETFAEIEKTMKHCANELNRIKHILQELYA